MGSRIKDVHKLLIDILGFGRPPSQQVTPGDLVGPLKAQLHLMESTYLT